MEKKSPGKMIAAFRKQHGMTQLELAEKMGVTDKAVSKWERDLSCPDVNTLPKLAELFHVSMEELMQGQAAPGRRGKELAPLIRTILQAVALAMGVAVAVLAALGELEVPSALGMLGLGLACLAAASFPQKEAE